MKKTLLRKYARLAVQKGINVKKGQGVVIYAEVSEHEFANYVMDEAYKAGAKWVQMMWSDQASTKLKYRHESLTTLSKVEHWEEARLQHFVDTLPCRIFIESSDPDGLKGVNIEKMQKSNAARMKITKPYREKMDNLHQWCIIAIPSKKWAKKIFPEDRTSVAVEKLWDAIFSCVRITEDNDPVEAWAEHNANLKRRYDKLNSYHFDYMHYQSKNGTDFKCKLIPQAKWTGGSERIKDGTEFNPNMPTEEIFTSPKCGECEGTVVATMPLSYMGNLIENFSITFKDGRAVDCKAEKNEELLRKMISMDDGAAMLGELALVPDNSPISNSGILFYNTLFDENAACHLALGRGFDEVIEGYENMSKEEIHALGINDSIIHVDFMIGGPELNVTGYTKDGKAVPVFVNGNWAENLD